jgi:hypothetical protein
VAPAHCSYFGIRLAGDDRTAGAVDRSSTPRLVAVHPALRLNRIARIFLLLPFFSTQLENCLPHWFLGLALKKKTVALNVLASDEPPCWPPFHEAPEFVAEGSLSNF